MGARDVEVRDANKDELTQIIRDLVHTVQKLEMRSKEDHRTIEKLKIDLERLESMNKVYRGYR